MMSKFCNLKLSIDFVQLERYNTRIMPQNLNVKANAMSTLGKQSLCFCVASAFLSV